MAGQDEPLRFSGGIKASVTEADAYIELVGQSWKNPIGLSPRLSLGPNLAFEIGIVYGGPFYPSKIGIAAGLAFGNIKCDAALVISESPNDELIKMHLEELGIADVVSLALTILETNIPPPHDFLHFKDLDFYLSTGATIGTIIYPPGASFSCDAIIFGKEATIHAEVNKA